jgi:hypothetical protein
MKGIIFNFVEDFVTETLSADAWDDVLASSGVVGSYTSLGAYSDEDFSGIIRRAAAAMGLSENDTLRSSARQGFAYLARKAPAFLEGVDQWRVAFLAFDDTAHPEVIAIFLDQGGATLKIVPDEDDLIVTFTSKRGLCALTDGLMRGCGDWFEVELSVEHLSCLHRGDESCRMRVVEAG